MNVLYISYSGMAEPLGKSQVLSYLVRLAPDHKIIILSYERPNDRVHTDAHSKLREEIERAGIRWYPLRYHKRPSGAATLFDILIGIVLGVWLIIRHRISIIHARSYVPSVIALVLKPIFGVKYIFDMRGFWADERVDGGLWPRNGRMYKVAKWFEKCFLLSADCVISLTQAAVKEMQSFPYLNEHAPKFEHITTCADLDLFTLDSISTDRKQSKPSFILGYVGSVGVWYLFDETLECFKLLKQMIPEAKLHILNHGQHDYIRERIAVRGIPDESVKIVDMDHAGVAKEMQNMDAGIFFYKPVYSKLATAPTKLGEFLGCGVPCMGNTNVGDMTELLEGENVGVSLSGFSEQEMKDGVNRLVELTQQADIQKRCRQVALRHFSLEDGVRAYGQIYNDLQGDS